MDSRHFLPVAALPQGELSVRVAQLLGLRGAWCHHACAGTWTASTAGAAALPEPVFESLVAGDQKACLATLSP